MFNSLHLNILVFFFVDTSYAADQSKKQPQRQQNACQSVPLHCVQYILIDTVYVQMAIGGS